MLTQLKGLNAILTSITPGAGSRQTSSWSITLMMVVGYGMRHATGAHMGGATDFKVGGTKQDSRAKKKFCTPHFSKCGGYKQANINRDLLNILKFAVWLSH